MTTGAVFLREWRALRTDAWVWGAAATWSAAAGLVCAALGAEVALMTAPAMAMAAAVILGLRAWASEWARGAGDALLAAPVSLVSLAAGKLLAGWLICTVAIAASAPAFIAAVATGAFDAGQAATAGVGVVLLSAAFLALCHAAAVLAAAPFAAIALSIGFCGIAVIGALAPVQSLAFALGGLSSADMAARLSLMGAYQSLARGVLDVGALVVLTAGVVLGGVWTWAALHARRGG